jgi:transcriptional regulator with XRE-family HTH domain
VVPEFDVAGALRRIRRRADLSQRELAAASGLSQSSLAKAEAGRRGLTVDLLAHCAALAGLRLALLDESGTEVPTGDEDWWHGQERYSREQPWYTFDRLRYTRDHWRTRTGTPEDHRVPQPGDSPADRRAARARAARRRREEERERRLLAGASAGRPDAFTCSCPPGCDELDDRSGPPVHADDCPCSCDLA